MSKIRSNPAVPYVFSIAQSLAKETVIGIACGDGQTIAVTTAGVRLSELFFLLFLYIFCFNNFVSLLWRVICFVSVLIVSDIMFLPSLYFLGCVGLGLLQGQRGQEMVQLEPRR